MKEEICECGHLRKSHTKIISKNKEYRYYCEKALGGGKHCRCKKFVLEINSEGDTK